MLPKCPKCNKKIEELRYYERVDNSLWFSVDENGEPNYEGGEIIYDGATDFDFCCPECSETLFTDEEKAIEFLKNKDELQELVKEKINKIKNGKRI
ncbi:hypothetical protein LCGC14_1555610 [marine sediment metagenome]|uniref:Uncharacterized protein n=1 Tax=marine sediment metagenome TaxID=412755 RepID=A0A0F9IP04_9ZZZZ